MLISKTSNPEDVRTVKTVTTALARLILIETSNTLIANGCRSLADAGVRMLNTSISDVHAAWHVRGHDITSSFVGYRASHTGISRAKRLPVAVGSVLRRHEAIAN